MNDPQNLLRSLLAVIVLLTAAIMCPDLKGQSFYQSAQRSNDSRSADANTSTWQPPPPQPARTAPSSIVRQATNLAPLNPPRDIFTYPSANTRVAAPVAQTQTRSATQPPTHPPFRTAAAQTNDRISPGVSVPQNTSATTAPARFEPDQQFNRARALNPRATDRTSADSGGGLFSAINSLTESDQPKFVRANLETDTLARSDFDALASGATSKLGDVKDWVGEKTDAMLGGLKSAGWQERISQIFGGADIKKIVGGLAVVIGGYLGLVWLLRMINPGGSGAIPREVLEVVGSAPLNSKQNLQLIRLGSKLLLMMHGPEGTQPIGEVNDPVEVEQLLAMCGGRARQASPAVRAAIESSDWRQNSPQPAPAVPEGQGDAGNLNQLLRALEKYQGKNHLFEA